MRFKTKEDLLKECSGYCGTTEAVMVRECFESFSERIEFYKKYRHRPTQLKENEEYIFKKIPYSIKSDMLDEGTESERYCWILSYEHWFFDYCFGDVIDD